MHDRRRRRIATAYAGRREHAHVLAKDRRESFQEILRPRHFARQRIAHPHGERRRRRFALLHDIEMVVEGRHFVDLGERKPHFRRERREVRRRQMAVSVLQLVQVLDEEIALGEIGSQQRANFLQRLRVDNTALRSWACFHLQGLSGALILIILDAGQSLPATWGWPRRRSSFRVSGRCAPFVRSFFADWQRTHADARIVEYHHRSLVQGLRHGWQIRRKQRDLPPGAAAGSAPEQNQRRFRFASQREQSPEIGVSGNDVPVFPSRSREDDLVGSFLKPVIPNVHCVVSRLTQPLRYLG